MTIFDYLKDRKYVLYCAFCIILFSLSVRLFSDNINYNNGNIEYISSGSIIFFIFFLTIDFITLKIRINKMIDYIRNTENNEDVFNTPIEKTYANEISRLIDKLNEYNLKVSKEYNEELEFVTKWVHDIKVPISSMKLQIENSEEINREMLELELMSIEENTQKILYRIKAKSFYDDFKIVECNIKELVFNVLKNYATFFSIKRLELKLEIDEYNVLTDSKWSNYIISQYISNAIKYSNTNGEISIKSYKEKNIVTIFVKNSGDGIKSNDLNGIFNRGYTATSNRLNSNSTGYGLYLSKKLASKLGHKLYAKSQYKKFAEFAIVYNS